MDTSTTAVIPPATPDLDAVLNSLLDMAGVGGKF